VENSETKHPDIDLERLLKLRLVVARFGEMDMARWWNTGSLLGRHGKMAIRRGFPKTHPFVQAKIVFAVAGSRCAEIHNPPGIVNLWNLPAFIENRFEGRWPKWLDRVEDRLPFFDALARMGKEDLMEGLIGFDLVTPAQVEMVGKMRRTAEGRAVQITRRHALSDELLTLLAAGFGRGEPGRPSIPYIAKENVSGAGIGNDDA